MRLPGAAALLLIIFGVAPIGTVPASAAEPYHLRIGWVVVPSDLIPLMFLQPGLAPHAGKPIFRNSSTSPARRPR